MRDVLLLVLAGGAAVAGMGWFALAMDAHWRQVHGAVNRTVPLAWYRTLGVLGLVVSLGACLAVNPPAMAVLVWVMLTSAALVAVALVLTWRAAWLRRLGPWPRRSRRGALASRWRAAR